MLIATLACVAALVIVMTSINPFTAGTTALGAFYVSFFLTIVGAMSIVGVALRSRFFRDELQFVRVAIAFRQAVWFAILAVGTLFLSRYDLLNLFTTVLFIALLTVGEAIIVSFFSRRP
jgi:predicted MFS family arabinose efflux permease